MTDSTLLQPGWREARHDVNGVHLHTIEAGEAGASVVMLLHGFPDFWWGWRRQIDPLAAAGYHVVVPDMRGYNSSDAPQEVAAYRLDLLAADVLGLADTYGAERFHLVGHDWGAIVSWWVAARHPDRLGRMVVMDGPHPDVSIRQLLARPTQALRSTYVAFFQIPRVPEAVLSARGFAALRAAMRREAHEGAFEPGALDRYAEAWSHPGSLTGMLNYYRALRHHRAGAPSRIAPPTLILWGENDTFLEHHVAEQSLELCDAGRMVVIEDSTHWLHLEQPDRVNAEILGFLAEPDG